MSGPKTLLDGGMAFLRESGMGLGETAILAMQGMTLVNDLEELRLVGGRMSALAMDSVVGFIFTMLFQYLGPKLFYPHLLLAPFTTTSDDASMTTTPGIFVNRFATTKFALNSNLPYAHINLELVKPQLLIQKFEFQSPKIDSTLTGKIHLDMSAVVVNVTVKIATSNCLMELVKMNVSPIQFKPKIFIDDDARLSHPVCDRLADFVYKEFKPMFVNRVYKAVFDRLRKFRYGRSLLKCSGKLEKTLATTLTNE